MRFTCIFSVLSFFFSLFCYVHCHVEEFDIIKLLSNCTRLVNQLEVMGVESMVPSRENAIQSLKKIGEVIRTGQIANKDDRVKQFSVNPDFQVVKARLTVLAEMFRKHNQEQIQDILEHNQDTLESIVKMSLMDGTNRISPLFGTNSTEFIKEGITKVEKFFQNAGKDTNSFFIQQSGTTLKNNHKRTKIFINKSRKKRRTKLLMDADSTIDKVLGSAGSGDNVNFELGDNTDGNLMIESGSGQEFILNY